MAPQHVAVERDALAGIERAARQDAGRSIPGLIQKNRKRQVRLFGGQDRRPPGGRTPPRPIRRRGGIAEAQRRLGRGVCRRGSELAWRCGPGLEAAAKQLEPQELCQRENVGEQLGALEPLRKPGAAAVLGVELAHHHHALPIRDRHQDRAPAQFAEFAEGLSGLILLVEWKIAGAQKKGTAASHGGEELIELALEAATLGGAIAQEDARLRAPSAFVLQAQVEGRQVGAEVETFDDDVEGAPPFGPRQGQRVGQNRQQFMVVGGNLGLRLRRKPIPALVEFDERMSVGAVGLITPAKSKRGGERGNEAALYLLGPRVGLSRLLAHARLRQFKNAARRQTAELLEKLRAEEKQRINVTAAAIGANALGDDELRFLGCARLLEGYRTGLLDPIDVGLRQHLAHLAVEIAKAGEEHDGRRHAIGNLNEIPRGLLKALVIVLEEAQILHLIDGDDECRAVNDPHQASK